MNDEILSLKAQINDLKISNELISQKYKNSLQRENELLNKLIDLQNHLDTFILAFNSLWRCCNSKDVLTDLDEENSTYLEFRCGFENVCVPVTEDEISAIKKACDFLDITVSEVLE